MRKLRTPRSARAMVSGVLVPPPRSSVVTNTLPWASTAVSYSEAASSSNRIMLAAVPNSRAPSMHLASCHGSGSRWAAANGRISRVLPPEWMSRA
ncbi:hypothetical protein D9M69_708710 [compost metagenome]